MKSLKSFAAAALVGAATISSSAFAGEVEINKTTAAARIDVASIQRTLAERMDKLLCFAVSDVNAQKSLELLDAAITEFESVHVGIKDGAPEASLFPERSRKVLAQWREVDKIWRPLKRIVRPVVDGAALPDDEFNRAMLLGSSLRERSDDLVNALEAEYASELGAKSGLGEAMLLNLYARQGLLSQTLGKDLCLLAGGHGVDEAAARAELIEALSVFETSLAAFQDGMPMVGVPKPPSDEIAAQIAAAAAVWAGVSHIAHDLAAGGTPSQEDKARFAVGVDLFLTEMNGAVHLLAKRADSLS